MKKGENPSKPSYSLWELISSMFDLLNYVWLKRYWTLLLLREGEFKSVKSLKLDFYIYWYFG